MIHFAQYCDRQVSISVCYDRRVEASAYSALAAASFGAVNGTLLVRLALNAAFSSSVFRLVIVLGFFFASECRFARITLSSKAAR